MIAYNVPNVVTSTFLYASSVGVAKSAASKVSEVTQGDTQLQQGIDQMVEFVKTSKTFKTGKKLLNEQQKQKERKKKKIVDNFSDVEPDDPVSVDTDENANVVAIEKAEKSKISENELDIESVVAETVVISSDAENTDGNDKIVSSNSDADLQDIEKQVNKSLQGVTFNVIEDLVISSDSDKPNHDFGIRNVQWKEGSTAEFVDIMNWADDEARTTETEQNKGMPDSTAASPTGEPFGGDDPTDQVVIDPKNFELPPKSDDLQGQPEESTGDIPMMERLCKNGITADEKEIKKGLERLHPLNSDKVTPVPKNVARQLFADEEKPQPKLIPPERIERVDVLTVSCRKSRTFDQADPKSKAKDGDVEKSEVTYYSSDPRLDNFTPYYWREKSEMRKYYSLPVEFPTIAGAERFGINFATEPEEERQRQLNYDEKRTRTRS